MRAILFVIAVLAAGAANAQAICNMPKEDAHTSVACVRWYSVCCMRQNPRWPPPEKYSALSFADLKSVMIEACYRMAEQNCLHFNYTDADTAGRNALNLIE